MLVNTEVNPYFPGWMEFVPDKASIWEHYIQNYAKTLNHNQIEVVSIDKVTRNNNNNSYEELI